MIEIYAPEGRAASAGEDLADSVLQLQGKRLGILDNTKPNASVLLERMADHLGERGGCELVLIETKNAALAAPDQVMGRLTKEVELVLTGSAD